MNRPNPITPANENDHEFWRRQAVRLNTAALQMQRECLDLQDRNQQLEAVQAVMAKQVQDLSLKLKQAENRNEMLASAFLTLEQERDTLLHDPALHGSTICEFINDLATPFRNLRAFIRRRRRERLEVITPMKGTV